MCHGILYWLTVLKLVSSDRAKQKAGLNFHPSTKKSPSVLSGNVSTQNLLVEISVPRRTGRKRKRESTEPFGNANLPLGRGQTVEQRGHIPHLTKEDEPGNTAYLLRSLQDCAERYEVRVVGRVEYTHRFRCEQLCQRTTRNKLTEKPCRTLSFPQPTVPSWISFGRLLSHSIVTYPSLREPLFKLTKARRSC